MADKMFERVTHPMSQKERAKRGDELADAEQDLVAVKAERKETVSELNARIKTLQSKCEDLSKQIKTGVHEEDIAFTEQFDDARKMVTIHYEGDVIPPKTRKMTIVEIQAANVRAQGTLPLDQPGPEKANGAAKSKNGGRADKAPKAEKSAPEPAIVDDDYVPEGATSKDPAAGTKSDTPADTAELNGQPLVNARKGKKGKAKPTKAKPTKVNPKRKAGRANHGWE